MPSVSRRIVSNPGARVSPDGFAIIVAQAEYNPELAVEAGIRVDLPSGLAPAAAGQATEAVRTKLLSRAPPHLFEEIRSAIAASAGERRPRNVAGARLHRGKAFRCGLKEKGELNEATLSGFARQKKYEETVVALAELAQSTIDVVRPLMQSLRDDGLLVACKAAGLDVGNDRRRPGMPLFDRLAGRGRVGAGKASLCGHNDGKRAAHAQLLAGARGDLTIARELSGR